MRLVVKIGGSLISEGYLNNVLSDLASVQTEHQTVIVHGGAASVSEISRRLGKEPKFVTSPEGIKSRYTDAETVKIYTMVMSGMIAPHIVAELHRLGKRAISLAGYDAGIMKAERKKRLVIVNERGRRMIIEGGYTGRITSVDTVMIESLLDNGLIPVISPVAISNESELLNVDSDRAASSVASSIKATKLILLSNVDGLIINEQLVRRVSPSQAKELLPKIGHGMDKKVMSATEAVENGVKSAIISSGKTKKPVIEAAEEKRGTVITLE
ncbi:MAG: [LysW]-aminoadipate/[LysW]-glutamate kinase [Conexivisphaerales archaeon]